ncbi:hypothetical protein GJ496_003929 [Pomphorhynchus laevis]|nr:hypothetical protein GJ496_003929 [Pomphorhynchus laevis]
MQMSSLSAQVYNNTEYRRIIIETLAQSNVPSYLRPVLSQLAPMHDLKHKDIEYVPSFGAYSHIHDFDRTLPATLFLEAHNVICAARTNADPAAVTTDLYNTVIVTINGVVYNIGHYLAGPYILNANRRNYRSNFRYRFETLFNPIIGRTLSQRPSLGSIDITPIEYPTANYNTYDLLLGISTNNSLKIKTFLHHASTFHETLSGIYLLANLLREMNGATIISHSIKVPTLPTWHHLEHTAADAAHPLVRIDAQTFATDIEFLTEITALQAVSISDAPTSEALLYLRSAANPISGDFPSQLFNEERHLTPNVLYFQSYDTNECALSYVTILGLKIESADLDGSGILIPNPEISICDNISQIQHSTKLLSKIMPICATLEPTIALDRIKIYNGTPVAFARYDASRVIMPRFDAEHAGQRLQALSGFTDAGNLRNQNTAYTWFANLYGQLPPIPNNSIYLWSSYRILRRDSSTNNNREILFIATFRTIHGSTVKLCRSSKGIEYLMPL